jgi:hypothetical protein
LGEVLSPYGLPVCLLAYAAASLFHHVHNAEFLGEYPNMPAWLSPLVVYAAWLGAAVVGLAGYLLLRRGYRAIGLVLLAVYGCYGLDGLAHYALAPLSAHTLTMNLSIWFEAATAAALLIMLSGYSKLRVAE